LFESLSAFRARLRGAEPLLEYRKSL
jgi:hypothetical protein